MKLAPNLIMNFPTDMSMTDRIVCAADLGFPGVEMWGTANLDVPALARELRKHKLSVGMVVAAPNTLGLNDPENRKEIEAAVVATAEHAQELEAANVVVLSGNARQKVARSAQDAAIVDGLRRLVPIAEKFEVTVCIEMLNSLYDHPGYYLDDTKLMFNIVRAVNHRRVKALYDIYHAGIMGGNIIEDIRGGMDVIGEFHVAGIPGRNEPKSGEQNYPVICRAIEACGFTGWMGLEYAPLKDAAASLRETKEWLESGAELQGRTSRFGTCYSTHQDDV